ncbi:hypothetical protein AWB75_03483 [Caballeronia catudaia]|uniref:Uncharacterized protein n=1 Tax=Caballeronia catudaia TaxID=1777136 RepID=A0A158BGJ2_9BURK|nr:hypothetical protein AWB75_03483 [Caballeronia catudaia]
MLAHKIHERAYLRRRHASRGPLRAKRNAVVQVIAQDGRERAIGQLRAYREIGPLVNPNPCSARAMSGSTALATAVDGSSTSSGVRQLTFLTIPGQSEETIYIQ